MSLAVGTWMPPCQLLGLERTTPKNSQTGIEMTRTKEDRVISIEALCAVMYDGSYLTTLITRVIDMAVKPGIAGEYSSKVKVPLFAPGFNTARICAASPL